MDNPSKKRTGRPIQPVKRENCICIRLTNPERFVIQQKAGRVGMTLTAYIRRTAINGRVIDRMSELDRQNIRNLIQMSGDIHQLVKVANEAGLLKAALYFEGLRNKIDGLLKKLDHDK